MSTTGFNLILQELADETHPLSSRLLGQLSNAGRSESDAFARHLSRLGVERKQQMLQEMVHLAEESFELDFAALFRRCLDDPDPVVRRHAVEGLWEDESPLLAEALIGLLVSDPDAQVRAAAAQAMGRFVFLAECEELDAQRALRIRQTLEQTIDNKGEDVEVVRRAIEAIAFINDPRVRAIIDRAYEHSDIRMRQSALFAMGRNGDRVWAETVLEELHGDAPAMRYEAARSCGELQLRRSVRPLIQLVREGDHEMQEVAVWALGQIGGERAQKALERWAESEDEALSSAAQQALDELDFAERSFDLFVHEVDEGELADPEYPEEDEDTFGDDLGLGDAKDWAEDAIDLD